MTTTALLTNPYLNEDAILLDYCTEEGYGHNMLSGELSSGGGNVAYSRFLFGGAPGSSHAITVKVQTAGVGYDGKIIYKESSGNYKGAGDYEVWQTWGCPWA